MNPEMMERLTEVQAKYTDTLMQKAHVVGIGIGLKIVEGQPTETPAIVVLVDKKIPLTELAEHDILPTELEGIAIDVQETGGFFAV